MHKIIIDVNLWISFLINKRLKSLRALCLNKNIVIVTSPKVVEEYLDVSSRQKVRKYASEEEILNVFDLIKTYCVDDPDFEVEFPELTDPKDLYLFSLAQDNDVDFLLTGDKRLLALGKFHNTEIISFGGFMARLEEFAAEN
jgi:putative PIN family toxin of toxin-antitoxin system